MQAFKKDNTLFYSDYVALEKFCSKSCITEIYRRIPDLHLQNVLQYLSYLNVYEGLPPTESVSIWCQYLKIANKNNLDIANDTIAYPKNLKVMLDVEITKGRQKQYTAQEVVEFAETAKRISISFDNERWNMRTIKTIDEYLHYSAALCHQNHSYDSWQSNEFIMLIFDKKKNTPTALIHINGYFIHNQLESGYIDSVRTFGNISYCRSSRSRAQAMLTIPSEIQKVLKTHSIE
jgi:hypothetical protein